MRIKGSRKRQGEKIPQREYKSELSVSEMMNLSESIFIGVSLRKHVPKIEYASELSVSDIEDLGENLFPSTKSSEAKQLIFDLNKKMKFHDVDDSINLLFEDINNEGILRFGLA